MRRWFSKQGRPGAHRVTLHWLVRCSIASLSGVAAPLLGGPFAFPAASAQSSPAPADTVTLLLRFDHQAQFAGYYIAQWDGLYRDAGIEVRIMPGVRSGGEQIEVAPLLASGEVEFGIASSEAIVRMAAGDSLFLLASIFQRSPVGAYHHADLDILRPEDLERFRIGGAQTAIVAAEIQAMLSANGIPPWRLAIGPVPSDVPVPSHISAFLEREFDVLPAYGFYLPWQALIHEVALRTLAPEDWGIQFYGDALFGSARVIRANPALVERFVAASLEGWRRVATYDADTLARRIAEEYPGHLDVGDRVAYNLYILNRMGHLLLADVVPVGTSNPDRWNRIARHLAGAGLITREFDIRDHWFDPIGDRERAAALARERAERLGMVVMTLLAIALVSLLVLRRRDRDRRLALEAHVVRAAKLESVGRIAAGVAHDFNNMLAVVAGHAELLQMESTDPAVHSEANGILDVVGRANLSVRRILAYAGQEAEPPGRVGLSTVVTGMRLMLERAASPRAEISFELDPEDPSSVLDRVQLEQVVLNLVTNARDAVQPGGRIVVRTLSRYISDPRSADGAVARAGIYAVLEVEDDGLGMTPEIQAWIFEPFFSTKGPERGSGLGLATSQGFIRDAGGFVELDSAPGEGTCFRFNFPLADAES